MINLSTRPMNKSLSAERNAFRDMKRRCTNPAHPDWKNYGGRGIECRFATFEDFFAAVGPKPAQGWSLDRIDNARHYEPGNVRWADRVQQNRNRRNNHLVTYQGETLCLAAWAERIGIHHNTLQGRIAKGWPLERAFAK